MAALRSSLISIAVFAMFVPLAAAAPIPTWDQQMNAAGRFVVLNQFRNEAVLDKETGLVWEQSPSTALLSWFNALNNCYQKDVGGRKGWRLPTVEELASLVDPAQINLALPSGHPFVNVQPSYYWSATTDAGNINSAMTVHLGVGDVNPGGNKGGTIGGWCVRGGHGHDGQ